MVSSHINRLEETQKDIEKTIIDLQCRSMHDNLWFFGFAEPDGNRKEHCVSIVDELCKDYLRSSNISQNIERAHEMGRRRSGDLRPVVVSLIIQDQRESPLERFQFRRNKIRNPRTFP